MSENDITPEQAAEAFEHLFLSSNYLGQLSTQLNEKKFPEDDLLMKKTELAFQAVNNLRMHFYLLSHNEPGKSLSERYVKH